MSCHFVYFVLVFFTPVVARQAAIQPTIAPDVIAKRTKRHLDELEVLTAIFYGAFIKS